MYSHARAEYVALGFTFPHKPDNEVPFLPDDLGDLSDDGLMELFGQLTQWANYASVQVTKADIEEDEAAAALKVAEAKYMVLNTETGDKVTVVRAEREVDPEVRELAEVLARKTALRKMLATLLGNIERSTNTTSRELTRRVGLAGPSGRASHGQR